MDNYYTLIRISIKYNFNNITHFLIINNLINDKFIQITNNDFIILENNYIIDHYTNITRDKYIIFVLSQDKKDYIIMFYIIDIIDNNHNEIILHDVLLENELFLNKIIDILRLNNFKKIFCNDNHKYISSLYKDILCYKSSLFYKNNFRYINNLDNERAQYNIDKLNNLTIKDIKLDIIINILQTSLMINELDKDDIIKIDNIIDYYYNNLDKNICELFIYIRTNYPDIFHEIYDDLYDIIGLLKYKISQMYLDI